MAKKVEEIVNKLVEPIIEENGLELVDIEFVKEGSDWFLRIYIDKDEGVNLDDCEKISRILSDKLDEVDPIDKAYYLEVSSPGVERPLKKTKDFIKYTGHLVQVKTFAPVNGKKKIIGTIEKITEEELTLLVDDSLVTIPRDKISKANLVWEG